jgi:hypothetical protein
MELQTELFSRTGTMGEKGQIIEGPEHRVSKSKSEFGVPSDAISFVVQGGYFSNWNGDALQRELGKDGTCSRFYYDSKVCVDIGDPESDLAKKKRKVLFRSGLGYLCIPPNFPQDAEAIRKLYEASLQDYAAYEERHPRPAVLQETTLMDEKGNMRRAIVTAIDVKPGGKIIGSREQERELKKGGVKLSKSEVKFEKLRAKCHRRLRRSLQNGTPFRNPFIAEGQRLFPVAYGQ